MTAELLSVILALFFGAIGVALCSWGVYQSREIGGGAAIYVLSGFFFLALASYFVMAQIDPSLPIPFRVGT